jgi:hypothetical protein
MEGYADVISLGGSCLALIALIARHKELNDMGQTKPRFSTLFKIKRSLYFLLMASHTSEVVLMIVQIKQSPLCC